MSATSPAAELRTGLYCTAHPSRSRAAPLPFLKVGAKSPAAELLIESALQQTTSRPTIVSVPAGE